MMTGDGKVIAVGWDNLVVRCYIGWVGKYRMEYSSTSMQLCYPLFQHLPKPGTSDAIMS